MLDFHGVDVEDIGRLLQASTNYDLAILPPRMMCKAERMSR